jgi:hypothetical protein
MVWLALMFGCAQPYEVDLVVYAPGGGVGCSTGRGTVSCHEDADACKRLQEEVNAAGSGGAWCCQHNGDELLGYVPNANHLQAVCR